MAMVYVVYWQSTGGLLAQVGRLGPKVGSRLALLCIHHVNRVNSRNKKDCSRYYYVTYGGCCMTTEWIRLNSTSFDVDYTEVSTSK